MTFSYNIHKKGIVGDKNLRIGTFQNNGGSTGGTLNLDLHLCQHISLQYTGSSTVENTASINETMPCNGKSVTIVTDPNTSGLFTAIGL